MITVDAHSIRSRPTPLFLVFLISIGLYAVGLSFGQERPEDAAKPQRWAVIFVGLPGDVEHEVKFRESADEIQKWLIQSLEFPADQVLRSPPEVNDGVESAAMLTAETMRSMLADVDRKLQTDDAVWVFTIGHGNYDGKRAWFHVAGRDPSAEDLGRWLADFRCREQVVWLMHSSSGWFCKALARPGRIVVTATAADDESNETEFPYALATVAQWPAAQLDGNDDQKVSFAELYAAVVDEVLRRFKSDNRLPTEHAQLDDNGDGVGTEDIPLNSGDPTSAESKSPLGKVDGDLARATFVPYRETGRGADKPTPTKSK